MIYAKVALVALYQVELVPLVALYQVESVPLVALYQYVALVALKKGVESAKSATSAEAISSSTNVYTCLLYTSPSPRDRTRSRMPSSA